MSLFLCVCPQCYPLVMTGNKIKNRILYHNDHQNHDHHYHDYYYDSGTPQKKKKKNKTSIHPVFNNEEDHDHDDENENDSMELMNQQQQHDDDDDNDDEKKSFHDGDDDGGDDKDIDTIVIKMSTDAYFGGLPLQFEEEYPEELLLLNVCGDGGNDGDDGAVQEEEDENAAASVAAAHSKNHHHRHGGGDRSRQGLIHPDDFYYTMLNINGIIQKNVPCVGKIAAFAVLGVFTCGLTWLPLWNAGSQTEKALRQFLHNQNENVYKVRYGAGNVEWRLRTDLETIGVAPCSWIELRINRSQLQLLQQQQSSSKSTTS